MTAFADSEPAELGWGEVVPLSFMNSSALTTTATRHARLRARRVTYAHAATPPVVVWSMPSRRYKEEVAMVPELLTVGAAVFDFLDRLERRVVVVTSADLAHTHLASGPYGFSDAAEPF